MADPSLIRDDSLLNCSGKLYNLSQIAAIELSLPISKFGVHRNSRNKQFLTLLEGLAKAL